MRDNKTSQPADQYDSKIEKTIPFYGCFHEHTLDLVKIVKPNPEAWLDTGCGTGNLIAKAYKDYPETHFVLADPAEAMITIVKEKFEENSNIEYLIEGSESLDFPAESFDVITAILSHHYFDVDTRKTVTENCFRMLKSGGVYVNFESIRPHTENGLDVGLKRWKQAQLRQGKSLAEVERHLSRYGVELLPISIQSHLKLLREVGFSTVEVFWVSFMQAGFYAIK